MVCPCVLTAGLLYLFARGSGRLFASDFRLSYWPAAQSMLHGASPYINPRLLNLTGNGGFLYPAVGAYLIAPFGLFSAVVGGAIFTALNLAALPVSMRLLGVRDFRLYGVTLLWLPVITAWETANVTLLMVLGFAVLWRYRDSDWRAGLVVALMISTKPVAWPVLIWLLGTRRIRATCWAAVGAVVLNGIAWAALGFGEIHRYLALMSEFARQGERIGLTLVTLLLHLGVGSGPAYVLGLLPGAVACLACLILGLAHRERTAMVLCIMALLTSTSVIWLHYFALLIVPLALVRPRLSPAWALPLLMWVCLPTDQPATWQIVASLIVCTAVLVDCLRGVGAMPGEDWQIPLTPQSLRMAVFGPRAEPVGPPRS